MTSKCNKCGIEIEWRKEGDRSVPFTISGARHSYKECPKASNKPQQPQEERGSRPSKQTRWEGIKTVKEVKYEQVNEHLLNGWVILDRAERVIFVPQENELKESSESIYVLGIRA